MTFHVKISPQSMDTPPLLPPQPPPHMQSKLKHTHKDKQVEQDHHQFDKCEAAHFNL